jgi:hypothetical protein
MDWIDNNQERMGDILVQRTLERTRQDIGRRDIKKEVPQG